MRAKVNREEPMKRVGLILALAVALLASSASARPAAPALPAPAVVPADDCLRKPAIVSRALRPVGIVRVSNRRLHTRRPFCGGGFRVVGIIGPREDGKCLWTFYDPYLPAGQRVWSHWDYCP